MKIVIDIPDEMYQTVKDKTYCGSLYEELKNGTPLPEHHGRLIDADVLKNKIMYKDDVAYETWDELYDSVLEEIDNAPTAIEALEQRPCEDCISREAVRRILANERDELVKLHTVNPKDNPKADAMAYGVNWSLNTLMELPSVTPQPKKNETDAKYARINSMLFNYYENKREKRLRDAIRSIDCDPYMDIIVFYYRDRMTIEQIAESYKVDTSTIVRNKRRLCLAIYDSLSEE